MTQLAQNNDQIKNTYCVIDLETTGLDNKSDAIIEVASIRFDKDGVGQTFQAFVNPGRKIPRFIEELTGISEQDVRSAPSIDDLIPQLEDFIGDSVLIGHNIGFDVGFLKESGFKWDGVSFDTLDMSYILHPTQLDYSLTGLSLFLDLDISNAHRAMADCENTMSLFNNLLSRLRDIKLQTLAQINNLAVKGAWDASSVLKMVLSEKLVSEKVSTTEPPATIPEPMSGLAVNPHPGSSDLNEVFSDHGTLADLLPGFEQREEQLEMAMIVKEAFQGESTAVIEAGTGVGKSIAYLIPAMQHAKDREERVLVSTNTISLQDQLMEEDLPIAAAIVAGMDTSPKGRVSYSVLKGRRNYLCLRKFRNFASRDQLDKTETILIAKILVWLDITQTGDQAELNLSRTQHRFLWSRLNAEGALMCGGDNGKCFLKQARENAGSSDVVVINHSLLMANLNSSGSVLPDFGALIIDEAHHLEDQATQAFGFHLSHSIAGEALVHLRGRESLLSQVERLIEPLKINSEDRKNLFNLGERISSSVRDLQNNFNSLFSYATEIMRNLNPTEKSLSPAEKYRLREEDQIPALDDMCLIGGDIGDQVSSISSFLTTASRTLEKYENNRTISEIIGDIQHTQNSITEINELIKHFLFERTEDYVYWVAADNNPDYATLSGAPIEVSERLSNELFEQDFSVLITSATLSTDGGFDHIKQRLGINPEHELLLGSPFPYEDLATVVIPSDIPDPRDPFYEERVAENIYNAAMAAGGRTMALFTSYASLRSVFRLLKEKYSDDHLDILGQGMSGTPRQLIERIKRNPETVLLGTSSFWEGIDVRGDSLQVLIITRLPFEVPTDPVYSARSERYANPFMEYALPNAIIRFRQGFGRLVRSNQDKGTVFILDSRVVNSRYGHRFIKALPQMEIKRPESREVENVVSNWLGI